MAAAGRIDPNEKASLSDGVKCLKTLFGHSDFRPMQWKVIESILNDRRDNCFFASSAYGKSLTYQLPPVYTSSIGIVVSPLISLMQDKIREKRSNETPACYLLSDQGNKETLQNIIESHYNLVYVTPEYITGPAGENLLKKIRDKITLIAIEEAHCISKWGHDFRPSYCQLHRVRLLCPGVPILALSATATGRVQEDIINGLALHEPQITRIFDDRPNLHFSLKPKSLQNWRNENDTTGIDDDMKLHDITSEIWSNPMLVAFASEVWSDIGSHIIETTTGSIIVYCINTRMTEAVSGAIRLNGHECGFYNSEAPLEEQEETLEDFISGRTRIICATNAFGMGITKPDVRLVILYGAPSSLESFYQKAGGAGRDGLPAKCVLFHKNDDWSLHKFMREHCKDYDEEEIARKEELIQFMMQYVDGNECRRCFIQKYFETKPRPDCCDICKA